MAERSPIIVKFFPICVSRNETYKQKLKEDLDDLDSELKKLMEVKEDVMKRIENAEREPQIMKRTKKVEDWLSSVQARKTEADDLKKQVSEAIARVPRRRLRSKKHKSSDLLNKVDDLRKRVSTLKKEVDFDVVVEKIIPKDKADDTLCIEEESTVVADDTLCIEEESTVVGMQSMFDQVWKCVDGKNVGIVGLYGMGGVGKTTLLKQIKNKLLDEWKDYVKVIWVSVSHDEERPLERIQGQIGKQIGLFEETWEIKNLEEKEATGSSFDDMWGNKNVEEKALKIFNILSQKKFVLLLDDVWKMIDLKQVGVPFPPDPEKGSKIVFTTRSLEVCSLLEAEAEFKVECLPYTEAWELFRSTVGDKALDSQAGVREIAKAIVRKCHGLPLALVTIGRAMVFKEPADEWKDELQGLKKWTSSSSGLGAKLGRKILSTLKLSYDRLEKDMFKSCFMYCILFPSKYRIRKRDLIDYWIGEGLLIDRVGAPNQGYNVIDVLLDACLLEEEEEDYVKIHGLILAMILWITSEFEKEKGDFFVRTDAELTEAPEIEKWKNTKRVSVMKNKIKNLAKCPHCPHLQTLFLNSNQLENIGCIAYPFMPSLKVLNLSDNDSLIELPSEISTLIFLQHLDLSRTSIRALPMELKDLVNLKCLNLERTCFLSMIPTQMISNFSKLHVLRLLNCGSSTIATKDSVLYNDGGFLMEELLCLKHLNMMSIALNNFKALQTYLSYHKLQLCTQSLELQSLKHTKSLKVAVSYLNNLKTLCISKCEDLEELKIDFGGEVHNIRESRSFPFLEEVIVEYCSKLRDLTWLILAPNLKHLTIKDCIRMEEVINVGKLSEFPEMMANLVPFSKLKVLRFENLPNLRSIYWNWTDWNALPIPDLRRSEIHGCKQLQMSDKDKLKEIVEEESEYTATKKAFLDPSPSSSSL